MASPNRVLIVLYVIPNIWSVVDGVAETRIPISAFWRRIVLKLGGDVIDPMRCNAPLQ